MKKHFMRKNFRNFILEILLRTISVIIVMIVVEYTVFYEMLYKSLSIKKVLIFLIILIGAAFYWLVSCIDTYTYYHHLNAETIRKEEIRNTVIEKFQLSEDKEVEVLCICTEGFSKLQIRRMEIMEIQFWAKLTKNGTIEIIIKCGSEQVEKSQEIRDFQYFDDCYIKKV